MYAVVCNQVMDTELLHHVMANDDCSLLLHHIRFIDEYESLSSLRGLTSKCLF